MKTVPKDIKDQILERVRSGALPVSQIAAEHGISPRTIYGWISKGIGGVDRDALALLRLKRENKELKELLGALLLQIERGKKNRYAKAQF